MKKILSLLLLLPAFLVAGGTKDTQLWILLKVTKQVNPCFSIYYQSETRFNEDISNFQLRYDDLVFTWKTPRSWYVGIGIREIYQKSDGKWENGVRGLLQLTRKGELGGYKWSNRTQFEVRQIEEDTSLRNRLWITFPRGYTRWDLVPVVWEEVFFQNMRIFNQLRAGIGLEKQVNERSKARVNYVWLLNKSGSTFYGNNVIRLDFLYDF